MDPGTLAILLHNIVPVVACLMVFGLPVGIVWISKNHTVRMRELDLEERMLPRSTEERLKFIEGRLANIEAALGAPSRSALPSAQERAALLEGPPDLERQRTR